MRVNLTGPMLCIQQVLPAMVEAQSGRIVNIASTAGLTGYAAWPPTAPRSTAWSA